MILNISLRTDIVACYTDWLVDKLLHKDFIYSQNPRTKVTTAYSLKDVDCIAFCSKDYSKILPYIQEINSKYKCIYCYATIDHNLAKRIPENPNSELISGEITEPIKYVNNRVQISQELSLFD